MRHSILPQVGSYVIDCCCEPSCFLLPVCLNIVGTSTPEVVLPELGRQLIKVDACFGSMNKAIHSRSDHHLE